MKKKLTASVLCLALLLIMLLGSTLAWFTDESGTTNTMTVGNVKIQQNETDASGAAFEQHQHMYPAVIKTHTDGKIATEANDLWVDAHINNEITKIVTVENIGSEAAYVRTLFAFEMKKVGDDQWVDPIGTDVILNHTGIEPTSITITVGSTKYAVYVCKYADALDKGEISDSSLRQFYLASHVGNEFFDQVGAQYDILVLSQAVQEAGFTSADLAFNAALPLNVDNLTAWFTPLAPTPNP